MIAIVHVMVKSVKEVLHTPDFVGGGGGKAALTRIGADIMPYLKHLHLIGFKEHPAGISSEIEGVLRPPLAERYILLEQFGLKD